jgi:hypothetical protein
MPRTESPAGADFTQPNWQASGLTFAQKQILMPKVPTKVCGIKRRLHPRRLRLLFAGFGLLLAALLPGGLRAQGDGAWAESASPARLVFERPRNESFCLVAAPSRIGAAAVSGALARSEERRRPVRLVWVDPSNTYFLVDCRGVPEQQEVNLYLLTGASPAATNLTVVNTRPVRFYAQRTAGQDLPATWQQMLILDARVDRDPYTHPVVDFVADDETPTGWYRGDWQRKNHLYQFASWVLFPATGRYVCTLRSTQPAWLTLDDELLAESHAGRRMTTAGSRPRAITAGLHRVVVRGVTRQELALSLTWFAEGSTTPCNVTPVTGGDLVRARFEARDQRLHALALATIGIPYVFEGITNVFVAVTLESRSVSWDGAPLTCAWRCGGRDLGAGRTCKAVLDCSTWRSDRVELTVADNRGHTARDAAPLTSDRLPRNVYRVSGRLAGVPALGYAEDTVRPEIHVRASSPDDVDFAVEATIERANGSVTNIAGTVDIVRSWGRLLLPPASADAFSRISWRVLHGGVVLDRGTTLFEQAPFRDLPDALAGDALCSRTNLLMLVARHASLGTSVPFDGLRRGQRLLLLDGFLAPSGSAATNLAARLDAALAAGPDETATAPAVQYRRLSLRALEGVGNNAEGVSRLLPLAQLGTLLPADVVVVAPSCEPLGQGETPAQFERRLAAFVGLLAGPGHATVVLVTPPPFAILPGCEGVAAEGVRPPDARQVAEIVSRVADAYGLPVADLYTGFMTDGEGASLLRNGALTAAGMEQAVTALRRVVYGAGRAR